MYELWILFLRFLKTNLYGIVQCSISWRKHAVTLDVVWKKQTFGNWPFGLFETVRLC